MAHQFASPLPLTLAKLRRADTPSKFETPPRLPGLASELHEEFKKWNILTTRSRMKVLTALEKESHVEQVEAEAERQGRVYQKVWDEIITSEQSYLKQLDLLREHFMLPIQEKGLLPKKAFASVFGDLEAIYQVNTQFYNELTKTENIGQVFLDYIPYLKLYSSYVNDYLEISTMLEEQRRKNSILNSFLKNQEMRPEVQQRIDSLLIVPIQRVPRYRLLMEQLKLKLPPNHPEFDKIQNAVGQLEHVARYIESRFDDHRNMQKMLQLQRSLLGGKPRIVQPGRSFVKEGHLQKVSERWGTLQQRYFLLFNDTLLSCKLRSENPNDYDSMVCCRLMPLRHCTVELVVGKGLFKVKCKEDSLLLCAQSPEQGEDWYKTIQETIKQYKANHKTLRKESSSKRPLRRAAIAVLKHESLSDKIRKRKRDICVKNGEASTTVMSEEVDCASPKRTKIEEDVVSMIPSTPAGTSFTPDSVSTPLGHSNSGLSSASFASRVDSIMKRASESWKEKQAKFMNCTIQ